MCVAAIAWDAHPRWRLVAIGNRDEYHARPTAPLAAWNDGSGIIAGRDLRAGGTWLGVTGSGRFALVTNFRVPGYPKPGLASRGGLVTGWLADEPLAGPFGPDTAAMNPFNLCLADAHSAQVLTNHPEQEWLALGAGVHGLSNGAFHQPWPKTRQLTAALEGWLAEGAEDLEPLFAALRAETPHESKAPDEDGPEAAYSPVFIRDDVYGTRCSTVVAIGRDGSGIVEERSFDPQAAETGRIRLEFP